MKTLLNSCRRRQMSEQVMERSVPVNGAKRKADASRSSTQSIMTEPEPIRAIIRPRELSALEREQTVSNWNASSTRDS